MQVGRKALRMREILDKLLWRSEARQARILTRAIADDPLTACKRFGPNRRACQKIRAHAESRCFAPDPPPRHGSCRIPPHWRSQCILGQPAPSTAAIQLQGFC